MSTEVSFDERAEIHAALGDRSRLTIVDELALSDRSPGELADRLGMPTNLLAHHLNVLEEAGIVRRSESHGDGRRRYLQLATERVGHLIPRKTIAAGRVLFVCTHNSARSQLATALWNERSPVSAESAGSAPAEHVHDEARRVAAKHGLDFSDARPQGYDEVQNPPDLVISVCDRAREGAWPFAVPDLHWSVADPVEAGTTEAFESAFRQLEARVDRLADHVEPDLGNEKGWKR